MVMMLNANLATCKSVSSNKTYLELFYYILNTHADIAVHCDGKYAACNEGYRLLEVMHEDNQCGFKARLSIGPF